MVYFKSFASIICLVCFFVGFSAWLYYLSSLFSEDVHFPHDFEDLKKVSKALKESQKKNGFQVLLLFCSAYLYKQTFAIPGSFFSNLAAGAIFGTWIGFPLVCFLTATGASCCYLISKLFARNLLLTWFPDRISRLQQLLQENNNSLFYFLLSARLFPGSPNWLMNLAAPIIGVPIVPFYFSVLFGLIPYNFICVHTGSILSTLNSLNDIFTYSTLFSMLFIALVAALPGIIRQTHGRHSN